MMRQLTLQWKGQPVQAWAEKIGSTLWLHVQGQTYSFESAVKTSRRGPRAGQSNPGEILAPMPGKMTKIILNVGAKVAVGETVAVMEAMKMEYTLKASANGKIKAVHVSSGEQVTLGQRLIEIEIAT